MPAPLVVPAVGLLGKLGIGAKLASAFGAPKGLVGAKTATQLAIPGLTGAAKSGIGSFGSRMAGSTFMKNAAALMPKTAGEWGMRVAPDAIFGVMAGAMTPGDFGGK